MRYTRCRMLFGDDFKKIQDAKILLLGVGGVGSFCLDAMYRTGITDITIVDFDRFFYLQESGYDVDFVKITGQKIPGENGRKHTASSLRSAIVGKKCIF